LEKLFSADDVIKSLFFIILAAGLYYWGNILRSRPDTKIYTSEAAFFLAVVFTAIAILFFGIAIDTGTRHFSLLLFMAALIYAGFALVVNSKLI
jgi:hypothetical protein